MDRLSATSSTMLTESSEQYRNTITAKSNIDAAVHNHNDPRSPLQVCFFFFIHTFTVGTVRRIKHMHHLQTLTLPLQSQ